MYEKLDKLRAEVERCKKKIEDDRVKLKQAEARLQEAENSQILADVGALNLTPEQLADFLKLATSGKLGASGTSIENNDRSSVNESDPDDEDFNEMEDFDDEEN